MDVWKMFRLKVRLRRGRQGNSFTMLFRPGWGRVKQ